MPTPPPVWYFAYGSNMSVARMQERAVAYTQRVGGTLRGYRLVFNKVSRLYPGTAVANIAPAPAAHVEGVLYATNAAELATLDRYEGVNNGHYRRTELPISNSDGTTCSAWVYIAHPDKTRDGLCPSASYLAYLLDGSDMLSPGYVAQLQQTPTC